MHLHATHAWRLQHGSIPESVAGSVSNNWEALFRLAVKWWRTSEQVHERRLAGAVGTHNRDAAAHVLSGNQVHTSCIKAQHAACDLCCNELHRARHE